MRRYTFPNKTNNHNKIIISPLAVLNCALVLVNSVVGSTDELSACLGCGALGLMKAGLAVVGVFFAVAFVVLNAGYV